MAEDSTSSTAVSVENEITNKEEMENQENENNENALMEIDGSKMEVDHHQSDDGVETVGRTTDQITATASAETESRSQENHRQEEKSDSVQDANVIVDSISSKVEDKAGEGVAIEKVKVEETDVEITTVRNEEIASPGVDTGPKTKKDLPLSNEQRIVKEVEVKEEPDVDSYMVLEEADGDENDSDVSDEELTENEQLRKANLELNERLALLEEFIEVEFSEKFGRFIKKRAHLVDVMGIEQSDANVKCNGKRSSKSLELVGLLKIVRDQDKTSRSPRKYNRSETRERNSTQNNASSAAMGKILTTGNDATVKKDEAVSDAKPKRCHRCRATGHLVRDCPLPIDPRDRRVILRKERGDSRRQKRERDRLEGIQNPTIKAMRDRRRRITKALNRERQRIK